MEEKKITVSCSFSRKINLGNYESCDVWMSESRDIPSNASQEVVEATRSHVFQAVERAVNEKAQRIRKELSNNP